MTINERLNSYIKERGIKQIHISNETGITPDALSRTLRGERKIMVDEFLAICFAIGLNPNEFKKTA